MVSLYMTGGYAQLCAGMLHVLLLLAPNYFVATQNAPALPGKTKAKSAKSKDRAPAIEPPNEKEVTVYDNLASMAALTTMSTHGSTETMIMVNNDATAKKKMKKPKGTTFTSNMDRQVPEQLSIESQVTVQQLCYTT